MNNCAAIWCTLVIIPLFIFSLLRTRKTEIENIYLKYERDCAYGKSKPVEPLIEQGEEYQFEPGFGSDGKWVFLLKIIKGKSIKTIFCHLTNAQNWVTDGLHGFAPEAGAVYIAEMEEEIIKISKKYNRSRH